MALHDYVPESVLEQINKLGPRQAAVLIPENQPKIVVKGTPTEPTIILYDGEDSLTIIDLGENKLESQVTIGI